MANGVLFLSSRAGRYSARLSMASQNTSNATRGEDDSSSLPRSTGASQKRSGVLRPSSIR